MESCVQLKSVSFRYSDSYSEGNKDSNAKLILDQIDLAIGDGDFVSILGPSGCGKSTLLRLLANLDRPTSGKIEFRESHMKRGFVFQEPRLLPWRTVLENVKLPLELRGETDRPEALAMDALALEALEKVGLQDAAEKVPAELSGGMKMRVSVARALISKPQLLLPQLLLLDEPFSAVDEQTRRGLQYDLRKLWSATGMTVIFVTHSVSEAVFLSNRVLLLSHKKIQQDLEVKLPRLRDNVLWTTDEFHSEMRKVTDAQLASS